MPSGPGLPPGRDVLNDSDTDLEIVIYTAAPGSADATKLDLARVAGISPR